MDERTKEIRRVLTGFITYDAERSAIVVAKNLLKVQMDSLLSGTDSARILGVRTERHQYTVEPEQLRTVCAKCVEALSPIGSRVYLFAAPETLAVLCRPTWRNPLVVTIEEQNGVLLLCICTARSLLCRLNIAWMRKKLKECLPEELKETEVTLSPACLSQKKGKEKSGGKAKNKDKAKNKKKRKDKSAAESADGEAESPQPQQADEAPAGQGTAEQEETDTTVQ